MNTNTLPVEIRNLVIARAMASLSNRESDNAARAACRKVIRTTNKSGRVHYGDGAAIDALCDEVRARAAQYSHVLGQMPSAQVHAASLAHVTPEASTALAPSMSDEKANDILAAIGRIEKLIMMFITLCVKHFGGVKQGNDTMMSFDAQAQSGSWLPPAARAAMPQQAPQYAVIEMPVSYAALPASSSSESSTAMTVRPAYGLGKN